MCSAGRQNLATLLRDRNHAVNYKGSVSSQYGFHVAENTLVIRCGPMRRVFCQTMAVVEDINRIPPVV